LDQGRVRRDRAPDPRRPSSPPGPPSEPVTGPLIGDRRRAMPSARIAGIAARRPPVLDQSASAPANRRVFRSKVDGLRPTYGFEDVSLAPGTDTIEPADVELGQTFCGIELGIPIIASAMDAVVDPRFAGAIAALGGLAIMNIEGVQTRYDDPDEILGRISAAPDGEVQELLAEVYATPIREELIARRIDEIHAAGSKAAVAATPGAARRFGPFCAEHGAELFLVQSQVSSARHLASGYDPLSLAEFTRFMPIPVAVGNTTNSEAAFALMDQGAAAVFVGVGPGAACTTREVLGIGIPQVTAISDVAAATSRSSPTAGCAGAASWPRRSRPAPTS
jgi:IMP dehydrogenase family protein